jgi:hypothetical protein
MAIVMLATIAATGYLYVVIPKGYFPQQDNGTIQGTVEAAQDINFLCRDGRAHPRTCQGRGNLGDEHVEISGHGHAAMALGILFSLVIGCGLMALTFRQQPSRA